MVVRVVETSDLEVEKMPVELLAIMLVVERGGPITCRNRRDAECEVLEGNGCDRVGKMRSELMIK